MSDEAPRFPPLLSGTAVAADADPFAAAIAAARRGVDAGAVVWSPDVAMMRAAVVLAPEVPLEEAMAAVLAVANGFADALGALAPPEVGVTFGWPDRILLNGAECGRLRAAAATGDPAAEPAWLVVGVEMRMLPLDAAEPGERPDRTSLAEEGCGDIAAARLIESWARHMLARIDALLDRGVAPLHADWTGRCENVGRAVDRPARGVFLGLDERGGMLLKTAAGTRAIPLSAMLEDWA